MPKEIRIITDECFQIMLEKREKDKRRGRGEDRYCKGEPLTRPYMPLRPFQRGEMIEYPVRELF